MMASRISSVRFCSHLICFLYLIGSFFSHLFFLGFHPGYMVSHAWWILSKRSSAFFPKLPFFPYHWKYITVIYIMEGHQVSSQSISKYSLCLSNFFIFWDWIYDIQLAATLFIDEEMGLAQSYGSLWCIISLRNGCLIFWSGFSLQWSLFVSFPLWYRFNISARFDTKALAFEMRMLHTTSIA